MSTVTCDARIDFTSSSFSIFSLSFFKVRCIETKGDGINTSMLINL